MIALVRKLAGVLYAMWRDGRTVRPATVEQGKERHKCSGVPSCALNSWTSRDKTPYHS